MSERILDYAYSVQETGWWCGPASTQIALTARGIHVPERELVDELEFLEDTPWDDQDGTDSIEQVTTVLARRTEQPYVTVQIPSDPPSGAQVGRLWDDVVGSIDGGNAIVANIVAVPGNRPPGYPAQTIYHYVTVVGYNADTSSVLVADPARFGGNESYWLTVHKLATLIAPKGYSAAPTAGDESDAAVWADVLTQFVGGA
ncbi:C39 family peptidase [Nocardia sp. NPDC058633]|uniref:C39 family peptidase n=1 Tax=Nocardia sp. NPDC058633 TaxID=3346568 RepID=UPI003668556A